LGKEAKFLELKGGRAKKLEITANPSLKKAVR